jgi:hypothetical protein
VKDADFKKLEHQVGNGRIASQGGQVASGYKPDITVHDVSGKLLFILECEQKTDRKAFLGDLVKAEKYAEDCKARPVLIIVMQTCANTTTSQIARHLNTYFDWLHKAKGAMGGLCLKEVLVMSDSEYQQSVGAKELLASPAFRKRAIAVAYTRP